MTSETNHTAPRAKLFRWEFVIIMAGIMSLNALAVDTMLPAMDEISEFYALADPNRRQLVVYAYVVGFGAPQLVWGPLSDSLGRRPIMFAALAGYFLTGVFSMFAGSFGQLLLLRFAQGVFASGSRVVAVSMVRDQYEGRGMAQIMSLVMTVLMIVPILAPGIGQLVMYIAHWSWTFGITSIFGGIMFVWAIARLPETLPVAARPKLNLRNAFGAYRDVFRHRVTCGYMLASGVIFGSMFAFIGSAEQVFSEVYDKEDTFAFWFAGIAGGVAVVTFANSRFVERFGMRMLSQIALIVFILLSFGLLALLVTFGENFWYFFPVFTLMFACFGLIGANFNALAMEPLGEIAGTGSAAYGFATTTFSALLGWLIGTQYNGTSIPLIAGFVGLGCLTLLVVAITERGKLFTPGR